MYFPLPGAHAIAATSTPTDRSFLNLAANLQWVHRVGRLITGLACPVDSAAHRLPAGGRAGDAPGESATWPLISSSRGRCGFLRQRTR